MIDSQEFVNTINEGYTPKGEYITLGKGKFNKEVQPEAAVNSTLR